MSGQPRRRHFRSYRLATHRCAEVEQLALAEFHLRGYLSVRGSIASSAELLDHVSHGALGVVRSHLKNLRREIRRFNEGRDLIETVSRRGYRLISD